MVNDIKIPDFNLDDNFNIDGDNTPKEPPKKAEAKAPKPVAQAPQAETKPPQVNNVAQGEELKKQEEPKAATKPKPKLLFEEDNESVEIMNPSLVAKAKEPKKEVAKAEPKLEKHKPEKPVKVKQKKERKPMKTKTWLLPLIVVILGGGSYFVYTNGYVDKISSKVSNIKNRFFAKDTLNVAGAGTDNSEEVKMESIYEEQFLRKKPEPKESKTATTKDSKNKNETQKSETQKPKVTEKPKEPAKPKTTTTPAGSTNPGKYSIQVCSWQSESSANNEVRKIATTSLKSRVVAVDLGKKGLWYRVMVGSYETEVEAKRDLNRVMRITGYENCVVRAN
jgi:cell division septation protein DedD